MCIVQIDKKINQQNWQTQKIYSNVVLQYFVHRIFRVKDRLVRFFFISFHFFFFFVNVVLLCIQSAINTFCWFWVRKDDCFFVSICIHNMLRVARGDVYWNCFLLKPLEYSVAAELIALMCHELLKTHLIVSLVCNVNEFLRSLFSNNIINF